MTRDAARHPVGEGIVDASVRVPVRVSVLGAVMVDGVEGGTLARALIAALVVGGSRAGEVRTFAALADDIWGDDPPQNPRAALQTLVSRARASSTADLIVSSSAGYALGLSGDDVDVERARRLCRVAEALDPKDPAQLAVLDDARALWRGDPGADLGDAPIAVTLAEEAGRLFDRIRSVRARALLAQGRAADAVELLETHVALRPFDEAAHRDLMSALAAVGRTQEALAVFATLRARLRDELGASPAPETVAANTHLLHDDESRSSVPIRIGLTAAPNALIGRDADVAAVTALCGHARLVTVLGAGGLGKTRLAQAVASAARQPCVVFVELAGVRADDDILLAIADALGIAESALGGRLSEVRNRPDLRARTMAQLSDRETLLVLDNCEQVIEGVARWASDALSAVPDLRVLTTSRTPVAISAEVVYPLPSLSATRDDSGEVSGPAVELFTQRARAVRPGALLPSDVIARLCARLDGLPLAIELAAARVRTMTPEQIESRLRDRFALLTTGDRTAPQRHRTLQAVIEWSWDLLDQDTQRALTTLSVLPAGFSATTAADVLLEVGVDDLLDRLVSQSLLIVTDDPVAGGVRFRMLETVREFGIARLVDEGAEESAWAAVGAWAHTFAIDRQHRAFEVEAFQDIRAEHDNLLAVLRRSIEREDHAETVLVYSLLSRAWIVRGAFSELAAFEEVVLRAVQHTEPEDVGADALAVVLILSAFVLGATADPRVARTLARLRRLRREHPEMDAMNAALADIVAAGARPEAVADVLKRLRASEDPREALVGEVVTTQLAENEGEIDRAHVAARRAWELARAQGETWLSAMAAAALGQLASQAARPVDALFWLDRAVADLAAYGADQELGQQLWVRGGNLVALGRIDEARELFTELTERSDRTVEGVELLAIGWLGLAEADRAEGRLQEAAQKYTHAIPWFRAMGNADSPQFLLALAALVAGTTLDRSLPAEQIARWAHRLRIRAIATARVRSDYIDKPVLGTVLVGWSAWAITVTQLRGRGLEALALGELLGARQDLPSLHLATHHAHAGALAGEDAVLAARNAAALLTPTQRVDRAHALLRERQV